MSINIEESVARKNFENRVAQGWVDGVHITAQARVGDNRFGGAPYVVAGAAGDKQYEQFETIEAMLSRFEEITDEYGLEE